LRLFNILLGKKTIKKKPFGERQGGKLKQTGHVLVHNIPL